LGETVKQEIVGGLNEVVDSIGGIPGQLSQRIKDAISGGVKGAPRIAGRISAAIAGGGAQPARRGGARAAERDQGGGFMEWFGGRPGGAERWILPGHGLDDPDFIRAHPRVIGAAKVGAGAAAIGMTGGGSGFLGILAKLAGWNLAVKGGVEAITGGQMSSEQEASVTGATAGAGMGLKATVGAIARGVGKGRALGVGLGAGSAWGAGAAAMSLAIDYILQEAMKSTGKPQARAGDLRSTELYRTGIASAGEIVSDSYDATRAAAVRAGGAVREAGGRLMEGFQESPASRALRQELARLVDEMKKQAVGPGVLALPGAPAIGPAAMGAAAGGASATRLAAYQARFMRGIPGQVMGFPPMGPEAAGAAARAAVAPRLGRAALLARRTQLIEDRTKQQEENAAKVRERIAKAVEKMATRGTPAVRGIAP